MNWLKQNWLPIAFALVGLWFYSKAAKAAASAKSAVDSTVKATSSAVGVAALIGSNGAIGPGGWLYNFNGP